MARAVLHLAAGFPGAAYNRHCVSLLRIQAHRGPGNTYHAGAVYLGSVHEMDSARNARFWFWLLTGFCPEEKPGSLKERTLQASPPPLLPCFIRTNLQRIMRYPLYQCTPQATTLAT